MFGKHSPTLAESGAFWPHPAGVCRGWIAAGSLVVRCNSTASCWYQCCVPEIFSLVTPHVHQATHLSRLVKGKNTMHSYFFGPWKILKILGPGRNQTPDNRTQPLVSVHEAFVESLKPCHAGFHQTSGLWYLGVSRQGMAKIPSTPKICLAGVCLAQVNWAQKDVAPSEGTEKTRSEGCRLWGWFLDSQLFEANQRIGRSKLWPQKNGWDKETSWWFQPIWKILVKMGIFPR